MLNFDAVLTEKLLLDDLPDAAVAELVKALTELLTSMDDYNATWSVPQFAMDEPAVKRARDVIARVRGEIKENPMQKKIHNQDQFSDQLAEFRRAHRLDTEAPNTYPNVTDNSIEVVATEHGPMIYYIVNKSDRLADSEERGLYIEWPL